MLRPASLGLGLAFSVIAPAQSDAITEHADLQYAEGVARDGRRNSLDVYVPSGVEAPPVVMFVHGGGWSAGNKERYVRLARALCENGIACAAINTRMYPFVRPGDMAEDCARALGFLYANAANLGVARDELFLMGHSAGAHLVSWLALDERKWALSGVPRAALRGVIALSGVYDVRPKHVILDNVFGGSHAERAAASPLLHIGERAVPFFVVWAAREMVGLELNARMLVHRLQRFGHPVESVELPDSTHYNYLFRWGRSTSPLIPRLADYVDRQLREPSRVLPRGLGKVRDRQLRDGDGGLPAAVLHAPDHGAARQWLVLVSGGAENAAATRLACDLAARGAAVVVATDAGAPDRLAALLDWINARRDELGLPDALPFLAGIGDAAAAVAGADRPAAGHILLGATAAAAGLRLGMETTAPVLAVTSDGDPKAHRAAAEEFGALLTSRRDVAVGLSGAPIVQLLADGDDAAGMPLIIAAFLGL